MTVSRSFVLAVLAAQLLFIIGVTAQPTPAYIPVRWNISLSAKEFAVDSPLLWRVRNAAGDVAVVSASTYGNPLSKMLAINVSTGGILAEATVSSSGNLAPNYIMATAPGVGLVAYFNVSGQLCVAHAATLQHMWCTKAEVPCAVPSSRGGASVTSCGFSVNSKAVFLANGTVLTALSLYSGRQLWKVDIPGAATSPSTIPSIASSEKVVVVCNNPVNAFDSSSGAHLFTFGSAINNFAISEVGAISSSGMMAINGFFYVALLTEKGALARNYTFPNFEGAYVTQVILNPRNDAMYAVTIDEGGVSSPGLMHKKARLGNNYPGEVVGIPRDSTVAPWTFQTDSTLSNLFLDKSGSYLYFTQTQGVWAVDSGVGQTLAGNPNTWNYNVPGAPTVSNDGRTLVVGSYYPTASGLAHNLIGFNLGTGFDQE